MRRVALLYILVNLFNAWLIEDIWILISVSATNLFGYVVLVEVGKNMQLHTDMELERKQH